MLWSTDDILVALWILVAVMIVVVLYHLLFIVVDLRKIMRRSERFTRELEAVLMKPLAMTDSFIEWLKSFFEKQKNKMKKEE